MNNYEIGKPVWKYRPVTLRRTTPTPSRSGSIEPGLQSESTSETLAKFINTVKYSNSSSHLAPSRSRSSLINPPDRLPSLSVKISEFLHRTDSSSHVYKGTQCGSTRLSPSRPCNGTTSLATPASSALISNGHDDLTEGDETLSQDGSDITCDNDNLSVFSEASNNAGGTYDRSSLLRATISGHNGNSTYDRSLRLTQEVNYWKQKLRRQHEEDMEELYCVKKKHEKQIASTLQELEEQQKVSAHWKQKTRKAQDELNKIRYLIEESQQKYNILEIKLERLERDSSKLINDLQQEKYLHEVTLRSRESLLGEKENLQSNIDSLKSTIEFKDKQLHKLLQEIECLNTTAVSQDDLVVQKRLRLQAEQKNQKMEEQIEDLATQVELLAQAKINLERNYERDRLTAKKELSQKDFEYDELKSGMMKKLKAMEFQLEEERERNAELLNENTLLESKATNLRTALDQCKMESTKAIKKLKADIKASKVLLNDQELAIVQLQNNSSDKALIRSLKHQLEDSQFSRASAEKAKKSIEAELGDTITTLNATLHSNHELQEKIDMLRKENNELSSQLEENEEELGEVMKKYQSALDTISETQKTLSEHIQTIAELEVQKASLKDQIAELNSRLENLELLSDSTSAYNEKSYQVRLAELEQKIEFETLAKIRLEGQLQKLKQTMGKLQNEYDKSIARETILEDHNKKLGKTISELKEKIYSMENTEAELNAKKREAENRLKSAELEIQSLKADLRMSARRVEGLQSAIEDEFFADDDDDDTLVSCSSAEDLSVADLDLDLDN